jgi:hypothetical protein
VAAREKGLTARPVNGTNEEELMKVIIKALCLQTANGTRVRFFYNH